MRMECNDLIVASALLGLLSPQQWLCVENWGDWHIHDNAVLQICGTVAELICILSLCVALKSATVIFLII